MIISSIIPMSVVDVVVGLSTTGGRGDGGWYSNGGGESGWSAYGGG